MIGIMKKTLFQACFCGAALALALLTTTAKADDRHPGALYTMDNATNGNQVVVFARDEDGSITNIGSIATGGTGTGAGLPSQNSVLLSPDGFWLFVCNAGSDQISVFALVPDGPVLTDTVASGGQMPISLTLRQNLLYVLNAGGYQGGTDNITGFVFEWGKLRPLPASTLTLSASNTEPAQVSFSQDGQALIVTEQATSLIDTFVFGKGSAVDHKTFKSAGVQPFGFDVGWKDRVFVSEAVGGMPNASSASSYDLNRDGDLEVISGAVPTHQTAACWLKVSQDGRFAYTANAGSGTISGFQIAHDGSLELLNPSGVTGVTGTGSHPTDMAQSQDGRFLYSLNNGNGTISAFVVKPDGSLEPIAGATGLPTSSAGLAGR
jgi:6-phosphogluconolactonase